MLARRDDKSLVKEFLHLPALKARWRTPKRNRSPRVLRGVSKDDSGQCLRRAESDRRTIDQAAADIDERSKVATKDAGLSSVACTNRT